VVSVETLSPFLGQVTIVFSEAMDRSTVLVPANYSMIDGSKDPVEPFTDPDTLAPTDAPIAIQLLSDGRTAVLEFAQPVGAGENYLVISVGNSITDVNGNAVVQSPDPGDLLP